MNRYARYGAPLAAAAALSLTGSTFAMSQQAPADTTEGSRLAGPVTEFRMVRSAGAVAAGCLQGAGAKVSVERLGAVEKMTVRVHGLPADTEYDLFITQLPDAPFGVAWYQSDLETDESGNGKVIVRGRFNEETFAVATGSGAAPTPHHDAPFPDAATNPAFAPIHTYHVGLWFNDAADAAAAGCPSSVTPFNGEHTAGIQALSTTQFADQNGPLRQIP